MSSELIAPTSILNQVNSLPVTVMADPLSGAASALAVLGALIKSTELAYNIIKDLRNAPKELLALSREALELKAVLSDVTAACQLRPSHNGTACSGQTPGELPVMQPSAALFSHLNRAQSILRSLENFVSTLTLTSLPQGSKVHRIGFVKKKKEIRALSSQLQTLKLTLATLLVSKTLSHISSLDNTLESFRSSAMQHQHESMTLLQQILRGQTHTSYTILRFPATSETQEGPVNPEASSHQGGIVRISPNILDRRLTPYNDILPPKISCNCICHQIRLFCSPIVLKKSFGQIIVGVSGQIFSDPTCNELTCHDKSRYSITVTYYFPSWWIAKAIILTCNRSTYGSPTIGLYVRNLLPEHSLMIRAITSGRVEDLQSIFEKRISTPDDMEEMGWTGLTWAIHKNQVELCKFLLNAGADPYLQDSFGNTAIDFAWLAIFERQVVSHTQKYLRESFLQSDETDAEKYQLSRIHQIVLELVSDDLETELAKTPYSIINSQDLFGKTALLWATRRGDVQAVNSLLRNGANPNISDSMRRSPLHMAARSRSLPIIELLIKFGATPTATNFLNEMPAHYACYEEDSSRLVMPFVMAGIDVNRPSKYGRTLLDIAVQWNYSLLVRYLLSCGANIEGSNSREWTQRPLGRAIYYKAHESLKVLLDKGCDTDFVDKAGDNILHILARHGDMGIIQALGEIHIKYTHARSLNKSSEKPLDIAQTHGDNEIKELFNTLINMVEQSGHSTVLEITKKKEQ